MNQKKKSSTKRKKILFKAIIVLIIAVGVVYLYLNREKNTPQLVWQEYISKIANGDYEEMYEMLDEESKTRVSKEVFIARNKNIYERNRYVKYENRNRTNRKFIKPKKEY